MIADAPIAAAAAFADIGQKVGAFLVVAKAKAQGGLTWNEFGELLAALLRLSVATLDAVTTLTGQQKKELAMEAAAALFDTLADRCVPLVAWPLYVLCRPAIRALVLAIASGTVEILLRMVRATA
jgi:hypothetical protein